MKSKLTRLIRFFAFQGIILLFALHVSGQSINGIELPPACTNCYGTSVVPALESSTLGYYTVANDSAAFASGLGSTASGKFSTAFGYYSRALKHSSFAAGYRAKADSAYSVGLGYYSEAVNHYTFSFGKYVKASALNSMVIGKGYDSNSQFLNDTIPNSIMLGMGSTNPTVTIRGATTGTGSGNVGIGTFAPNEKLEIVGFVRTSDGYKVGTTQVINSARDYNGTNGTFSGTLSVTSTGNSSFAGNVGIGTTSPTQKLDVSGTIKTTGFQLVTTNGAGKLLQSDPNGVAQWTNPAWTINGLNIYNVTSNVKVGIGLNNPNEKLEIVGFVRTSDGYKVGTTQVINSARDYNGTNGTFTGILSVTGTGNSTFTGNVGIGTTSPAAQLQVGNGKCSVGLGKLDYSPDDLGNALGYYGINAKYNSGAGNFVFDSDGSNNGGALVYSTIGGNLHFITVSSTGAGVQTLSKSTVAGKRRMSITNTGNVGIGITNPTHLLEVQNNLEVDGYFRSLSNSKSTIWVGNVVSSAAKNYGFGVDASGNGHIYRNTNWDNLMTFTPEGKVLIGEDLTSLGGTHKLYVNGSIITTEVKIATVGNWPDYVFKNNYKPMNLSDLETYINQNHHLPDVPSETEVKENGMNLAENDAMLLKKIEELTLYILQQGKKIENLETELLKLKENK